MNLVKAMTARVRRRMGRWIRRVAETFGVVLYRKAFQPTGIDLIYDLNRFGAPFDGGIILDVGANIGQTALRFAREFPRATIHSFEPIPKVFDQLRSSVAALNNVRCHCLAVGASDGTLHVWPKSADQLTTLIPSRNRPTAGSDSPVPVRVVTLDRFCGGHGIAAIDLLKTDTEGFDLEVLRGAEGLLRDGSVRLIYSECGVRLDDTEHTPLAELQRFLEPIGYDLYGIYEWNRWRDGASADWANALFVRNLYRRALDAHIGAAAKAVGNL